MNHKKNITERIKRLAENDILHLQDSIFALGPEYQPTVNEDRLENEPLSFIVGEHPSVYSVSPLMWNAEYNLRKAKGIFIPIDIPLQKKNDLFALLDVAFDSGAEHFRVLTITNPYKMDALEYFRNKIRKFPERVSISSDAERIGATNQILVGPDSVFHVINSDGQGMANAIETYLLTDLKRRELRNRSIGIIGAGGAARGIAYELAKRVNKGHGSIALFNRTESKAIELAGEINQFFHKVQITAHSLDELPKLARILDILVSSITEGDPLSEYQVYKTLLPRTLLVDVNYGKNSFLVSNMEQAGRTDLIIRDGRGMVVEGYIIPSRELSGIWEYDVHSSIYETIGALFSYKPSWV